MLGNHVQKIWRKLLSLIEVYLEAAAYLPFKSFAARIDQLFQSTIFLDGCGVLGMARHVATDVLAQLPGRFPVQVARWSMKDSNPGRPVGLLLPCYGSLLTICSQTRDYQTR